MHSVWLCCMCKGANPTLVLRTPFAAPLLVLALQTQHGIPYTHEHLVYTPLTSRAAFFSTLHRQVSAFSFAGDNDFFANNIRCKKAMEPLGTLGDLGWYNVRLSLWLFNYELPEAVSMYVARFGAPTFGRVMMCWHITAVYSIACAKCPHTHTTGAVHYPVERLCCTHYASSTEMLPLYHTEVALVELRSRGVRV